VSRGAHRCDPSAPGRERKRTRARAAHDRSEPRVPRRRPRASRLRRRKQIDFFADSGILPNAGFFSELARRLSTRLLPPLRDAGALQDAIGLVYHAAHDPEWLAALPPELPRRFWSIVQPTAGDDHPVTRRVVDQMLEALLVVSHRVSALGLEPELVRNHPELMEFESPFIAQGVEATRFVQVSARRDDRPRPRGRAAPPRAVEQPRRAQGAAPAHPRHEPQPHVHSGGWGKLGRIEALAAVLAAQLRPRPARRRPAGRPDARRVPGRPGARHPRHFRSSRHMALRVTDNAAQPASTTSPTAGPSTSPCGARRSAPG
jgi:hypothetical protein